MTSLSKSYNVDEWKIDKDKKKILIDLMTKEVVSYAIRIGFIFNKERKKLYYQCVGKERVEEWISRFKKSTRKVVNSEYIHDFKRKVYIHAVFTPKIELINDQFFLRITNSMILTDDGMNATIGAKEGAIITKKMYNQYNDKYLNNLLFWISKLSNKNELINIINDNFIINPFPVSTKIDHGIIANRRAKEIIENLDQPNDKIDIVFDSNYIQEPDLIFGNQKEDKDPRIGLSLHGPYYYTKEQEPTPRFIRIGIIGSGNTITLTKKLLEKLSEEIKSNSTNKWLYPDFPGFNNKTSINCSFFISDNWQETIKEYDINTVCNIENVNQRISKGVNLFRDKISSISLDDNRPDVIICAIPSLIDDYCGISTKTRGAKRPKFTELEKKIFELKKQNQSFLDDWGVTIDEGFDKNDIDFDFRNALKGKIMRYGIPIQIIRESTLNSILEFNDITKTTQEPSAFAWNFSMGLYYKSNGKPWRLAKLRQDTCYVGISFYHNLLNPNNDIQTSMAQVFTHNGEGIVLRGSDVIIDLHKEPHLSEEQSRDLSI